MKFTSVSSVLSLGFAILHLLSVAVHPVMATNGNSLTDENNEIKLDGDAECIIGFVVGFILYLIFLLWLV